MKRTNRILALLVAAMMLMTHLPGVEINSVYAAELISEGGAGLENGVKPETEEGEKEAASEEKMDAASRPFETEKEDIESTVGMTEETESAEGVPEEETESTEGAPEKETESADDMTEEDTELTEGMTEEGAEETGGMTEEVIEETEEMAEENEKVTGEEENKNSLQYITAPVSTTTIIPNGGFEEHDSAWVPTVWTIMDADGDPSDQVWASDTIVYEGYRSLNITDYTPVTLTQTIDVEPGLYMVECYVWVKDGQSIGDTKLIANDKSLVLTSTGNTNVGDNAPMFNQNYITGVRVENDGKLTIALDIDKNLTDVGQNIAFIDNVGYERIGDLPVYPDDNECSDGKLLNGNFLDGLTGWKPNDVDAVSIQEGWEGGPDDHYLSFFKAGAYDVDVTQSIKNLTPGTYIISAKALADGSHTNAYIYGKTYANAEDVTTTNLPASTSGELTDVEPFEVEVGEDGYLTIGIHVDSDGSAAQGAWIGVDDITLTYKDPSSDDFIINNGYEDGDNGWVIGGSIVPGGRDGEYSLQHKGDGSKDTYQILTGLDNGYYTLTAYVQNNGGHSLSYLYADDVGGPSSRNMTAIPRTNFPFDEPGAWKLVTVRGIHITTGEMRIGLLTESEGAEPDIRLDTLRLVKDDKPYELLIGGDISTITYTEDNGGIYYDEAGNRRDPIKYFAENGWNIVRIRIYNNPGKGRGNGTYYCPEGYVDVNDALSLAKRAADAGMQIQISFHYSDYWTNPGSQMLPNDWLPLVADKTEAEAMEILEHEVYEFTKETLQKLADQGTAPTFVSLGNETQNSMMAPYGTTGRWDNLARLYNAGSNAVREVAPDAKVIIHLTAPENVGYYFDFFRAANREGVDYDIIGSSYYPFWSKLTAAQVADSYDRLAAEFHKPVFLMESGISFTPNTASGSQSQLWHSGPYAPEGVASEALQKEHMEDHFNEIKGVRDGMAIGDFYWDPVMLYAGGQTGWAVRESDDLSEANATDNTALFGFDGKALPVMDAYRYNQVGRTTGYVGGRVLDINNKPVKDAAVTMGTRTATTDILGEYSFGNVTPGDYSITAAKDAYSQTGSINVTVSAGDVKIGNDLTINGAMAYGSVSGSVSGAALSSDDTRRILVTLEDGSEKYPILANHDGSYTIENVPPGVYNARVRFDGYITQPQTVTVTDGQTTENINFVLNRNAGSISGKIVDVNGAPVAGATISASSGAQTESTIDGSYILSNVAVGGTVTVRAAKDGYLAASKTVAVAYGSVTQVNLSMGKELAIVENPQFSEGNSSTIPGWIIGEATTEQSAQYHKYCVYIQNGVLGMWDEGSSFTADIYQTISLPYTGSYQMVFDYCSAIGQEFYVYAADANGEILDKLDLSDRSDMTSSSFTFDAPAGEIRIGWFAKGNSGNWANIDHVALGVTAIDGSDSGDNGDEEGGDEDDGNGDDGDEDDGNGDGGDEDGGDEDDGDEDDGNGDGGDVDDGNGDGEDEDGGNGDSGDGNEDDEKISDDTFQGDSENNGIQGNYGNSPQALSNWRLVESSLMVAIGRNSEAFNYSIATGRNVVVTPGILSTLQGSKATLAMHIGSGITISISGKNIPNIIDAHMPLNLSVREGGIAASAALVLEKTRQALEIRQLPLESHSMYGMLVNLHFALGKKNEGNYANLYCLSKESGLLEYLGSYQVNKDGQAMFGIEEGADFLLTITAEKPNEEIVRRGMYHTIKPGDTLSKIASSYGIALRRLVALNPGIGNPNLIRPGQRIRVR